MKKLLFSVWLGLFSIQAATYYVRTDGHDTATGLNDNSNATTGAWLTINHATATAVAGDTINVGPGNFAEEVRTADHAGSSGSPITIQATTPGTTMVGSFTLEEPWVNIYGFYITNKSVFGAGGVYPQLYIAQNGSHCIVSNNTFNARLDATISPVIKWNGADAQPFGVAGSFNTIIDNTILNARAEMVFRIYGDTNLITRNFLANLDFADCFQMFGRSNYFTYNVCSNLFFSGLNANHADCFQFFGSAGGSSYGTKDHVIDGNIYIGGPSLTNSESLWQVGNMTDDGNSEVKNITIRNNVFIGIAAKCSVTMPNVYFYNNFFLRCATNTQNGGAVLIYNSNAVGNATGGRVFNNIAIDCGLAGATNTGLTYFDPTLVNVLSDYNYVAKYGGAVQIDPSHRAVGDGGGWDTTDWWEPNGGNGPVKNIASSSITVTTNTGLFADYRLGYGSKLIGAGLYLTNFTIDMRAVSRGAANWDVGPYQTDFTSIPSDIDARLIRAYSVASSGAITIFWPTNTYRLSLNVAKRIYSPKPASWTAFTSSLFSTTNVAQGSFTDTAVTNGIHYEYEITQAVSTNYVNSDGNLYTDYQYISTGYQVPLNDTRGNIILLSAANITNGIATEYAQLKNDLWGDGYKIYEHTAITSEVTAANWKTNIAAIKAMITNDYNLDTTANWYLFIIGHVPIPYSGLASPGSHTENFGANPADWYWVDNLEGSWTDSTVNNSTADFSSNWNVPGDGKFDQTFVPNVPKMRVSRIDFANLPAFSLTEIQLLQQYLNRNHQWRHKQFTVNDASMIFTNGRPNEAHNRYSSMFGNFEASVDHVAWLDKSTNSLHSYLRASKAGSGHYDVDGVSPVQLGTTQDFRDKHLYTVYSDMFGSYYGNWDGLQNSNIVLWAPLATTGYTIATYYASDYVQVDSSTMGEPIGQELFAMAANKIMGSTVCYKPYTRNGFLTLEEWNVYTSLLGDGTAKLRTVYPVSNLIATNVGSDVVLTWTASAESSGVTGYHIYRAGTNDLNNLTRLTSVPVTSTGYTNTGAASGHYTYSVRTVKLEDSGNRSFYNAAQGVFADNSGGSSPAVSQGTRITSPFTLRNNATIQ